MDTLRLARIAAGLLAVIALLTLISLDAIHQTVSLDFDDRAVLVTLVTALLGVDTLIEQVLQKIPSVDGWSASVEVTGEDDDE